MNRVLIIIEAVDVEDNFLCVFGLPVTCDRFLDPSFWRMSKNGEKWAGRLRAVVCDVDCVVSMDWTVDPASRFLSSANSMFSSYWSCQLRMCWAVACFWLTVLLRNRRWQLCSARRIGERVVICEDALLRRASVRSDHCVTVLVGIEVFLGKPDREGRLAVCCSGNGSSRKDVEKTAELREQFGELTISGKWKE